MHGTLQSLLGGSFQKRYKNRYMKSGTGREYITQHAAATYYLYGQ